jgi:sialic acid synthase SpsE
MKILSKEIYQFCEPYVIAEIGANHNGDMQLAKKIIDCAIEAGCDAVKFQSWTPSSIVSKLEYENNQKYTDSSKKHFGSLKEMVEKYYLTTEQHFELESYCKSKNITFCSTPFSFSEVDLLEELNVPFYKIASMDINNYPLLKYVAQKNKPIILSTGMSTLGEIENAITLINKYGNNDVILLHCISIYPPKYEDIHLNNISMLHKAFGLPVGFSDHTIGFSIPLASVALGACIIEKHFTIDKDLPGWDHEISADPFEMKIICNESKNIIKSLGKSKRIVSKAEEEKKLKFRRSIVSKIEMKEGHTIIESDLDFKRPGIGIPPDNIDQIIGKKVKNNIGIDDLIYFKDLN